MEFEELKRVRTLLNIFVSNALIDFQKHWLGYQLMYGVF